MKFILLQIFLWKAGLNQIRNLDTKKETKTKWKKFTKIRLDLMRFDFIVPGGKFVRILTTETPQNK